MNAKPKINHKIMAFSPAGGAADWCPLQHIRTFLGLSRRCLDPDAVLNLIDTRQIRWAWDIARKKARRPEVRIWRESLLACLARENGGEAPAPDNLSLAQVIGIILLRPAVPARRAATVTLHDLRRRLQCSRTHLRGLIGDGELCRVGRPKPGETPLVLYQSVVEFLKRRSMSI